MLLFNNIGNFWKHNGHKSLNIGCCRCSPETGLLVQLEDVLLHLTRHTCWGFWCHVAVSSPLSRCQTDLPRSNQTFCLRRYCFSLCANCEEHLFIRWGEVGLNSTCAHIKPAFNQNGELPEILCWQSAKVTSKEIFKQIPKNIFCHKTVGPCHDVNTDVNFLTWFKIIFTPSFLCIEENIHCTKVLGWEIVLDHDCP